MNFLTGIYLFYIFVGMYFLFLFIVIYFRTFKKFNDYEKEYKKYDIGVVIPCYNEGESVILCVEKFLETNQKKLIKKIVIVDDCSEDNSYEILKEFEKKYSGLVKVVKTPKNTGCAAGSKNYGSKFIKEEIIAFSDADSFVSKDIFEKTLGFFNNEKVAGITPSILVYNRKNILERIQGIEYSIIRFTRKLLEYVDSIYVTPGPLALYKRDIFEKIGRFDDNNLTEDIEITWRLVLKGYNVKMSTLPKVYTIVPDRVFNLV